MSAPRDLTEFDQETPHRSSATISIVLTLDISGGNPAGLTWDHEMGLLKDQCVEFHVITCKSSMKAQNAFYNTLAGITGSVTHLNDTKFLVEKIAQKVKQCESWQRRHFGFYDKATDEASALKEKEAKTMNCESPRNK